MSLTSSQLSTFKTAIMADATAGPLFAAGNDTAVAAYYNQPASGVFIWRPDLSLTDIANAVVWADFDGVSSRKAQTFQAMLATGALDATKANIRAGFLAVFGAGASLTALTAAAQRVPTRFETLFAASNVVPSDVYGYVVTTTDVGQARSFS